MEASLFSEKLTTTHQTTQCHNPKYHNLNSLSVLLIFINNFCSRNVLYSMETNFDIFHVIIMLL